MFNKISKNYNECHFNFRDFSNPQDELSYLFDEWVPYYRMKYAICMAINPASILEVGVRYGYSAITFLKASPDALYLGIDSDTNTFGGSKGAIEWAKKITEGYKADFLIANTQLMATFPGIFYDFIHIDGQQDGDGTVHDLELALPKAKWILLDGYFWSKENMLTATYFLEKYRDFIEFSLIIPSYAGELLIKTKPSARYLFSDLALADSAHYSALQKTYDTNYFMKDCGGFDAFKKNYGQKLEDPRLITAFCLANPDRDKKILDIGCGRGELASALALTGADVIGIDYSQAAIDIAIRTFLSKQERSNLNFFQADFLTWTSSDQFDIIIATDLIEHIENEPLQRLMKKISELLKPNGMAIFHTAPNKHYYDSYYSQLREKVREAGSYLPENPRTYYEDLMHINEQTPEGLRELLKKNFSNCVVWVAKDNEMIGSLDKNYPPESFKRAREIFAVASHRPILIDEITALLSQQPLDRKKIKVQLQVIKSIPSIIVNQHFSVSVQIHNESNERLASFPPYPIHFSYHWLDKTGNVAIFNGIRTQITPPLNGNDTQEFPVSIIAPSKEGEYILQLTLVQELMFWFEEIMPEFPVRLEFLIKAL